MRWVARLGDTSPTPRPGFPEAAAIGPVVFRPEGDARMTVAHYRIYELDPGEPLADLRHRSTCGRRHNLAYVASTRRSRSSRSSVR
jgi:hypothetical protein